MKRFIHIRKLFANPEHKGRLISLIAAILLITAQSVSAQTQHNYGLFYASEQSLSFNYGTTFTKTYIHWNESGQIPGDWMTVDQYNALGSSQITDRLFIGTIAATDNNIESITGFTPPPWSTAVPFPAEVWITMKPNTTDATRSGTIRITGQVVYCYNDRNNKIVDVSYDLSYTQKPQTAPEPLNPGKIASFIKTSSTTCTIESIESASVAAAYDIRYMWYQRQEDSSTWTVMLSKTTPSISVTATDVNRGCIFRRQAIYYSTYEYSNECKVVMVGSPSNEHYIMRSYYNYMPGSSAKLEEQSISYYDAWGRVRQQVEVAASANCKDIITHFEYDNAGRSAKTFLPYAETANSQFRTNAASAQVAYYSALYPGETHPYSEKIYEASALDRVKSIYNYGKVLRTNDKKQTFTYDVALNSVRRLVFNPADGGFTVSGTHAKLFVNGSTNEDGQTVRSYTDGFGKTVASCTETEDGNGAWTMYVYDGMDRLSWVVSPEGAARLKDGAYGENHDLLKKYCYMYKYSYHRNMMIAKRLPGAETVYMLYDRANNLIGVQDGNQRTRNEWTLTLYDIYRRMSSQWSVVNTSIDHTKCPHIFNVLLNSSTSSTKLLAYSYDTYPAAAGALAFSAVDGVVASADKDTRTKGMKTYEWVKIIGDNAQAAAIERAFYYDKQGRVIQTVEKNHFGRISAYSSRYDFVGNVLASVEKHDIGHPVEFTLTTQNTFDHRSRLLTSKSKVNNSTEAKTNYGYNDVGQMVKKQQDGEYNTTDYSYNIQGWMTKSSNQFFTEQLKYYDPEIATTKPLYSGNISEMRWRNRYPSSYDNRFAYTYDKLNRLTGAEFYSDRGNLNYPIEWFTEKGITYDLNGNMTAMNRFVEGKKTTLSMTYDGNQLAQFNKAGYFEYDANGNTTATRNTGKDLQFEFNSLNLLDNVKQNGAVKASYTWAADGVKISAVSGNDGFEYLGSMVFSKTYSGIEPESVAFPEGRFMATSGAFTPVFHHRNHLGSVCAESVIGHEMPLKTANDYMPYGTRFSADGYGEISQYTFSGKERQTLGSLGLLDFGARMYDPTTCRWLTNDPLAEKYYSSSPYAYALNNPVNAIDPDGRLVIFINGFHWNGTGGKAQYWDIFDKKVMNHLKDYNAMYYDGAIGGAENIIFSNSLVESCVNPVVRHNAGYKAGQRDAALILAQLARGEKIKVVTHSMGAAYGKGFVQALIDMGIDPKLIEFEADFAPFQPTAQRAVKGVKTFQFSNENDDTANNRALGSPGGKIKGADVFDNNKDPQKGHAILDFWNKVNDLPTGDYNVVNGQIVPVKPKKK